MNTIRSALDRDSLHLVCGSGGTRAFLTSAGAILAFDAAGIKKFKTLGGASGGSIITALYASGIAATDLVRKVLEYDFSTLFEKKDSIINILRAHLPGRRKTYKHSVHEGFLSSIGLGLMIERHAPTWPENFWTVAVSGNSQYVFNAQGVFQYTKGQEPVQLTDQPVPIGMAVRASCAIPGILEAIELLGRRFFDGALSIDGDCPTGVARRHYGAKSSHILACNLDDPDTRQSRYLYALGQLIAGHPLRRRMNHAGDTGCSGEIYIASRVEGFGSLQFTLTANQKQNAVLSGFSAAVEQLANAGLLDGERLELCNKARQSFTALQELLLQQKEDAYV